MAQQDRTAAPDAARAGFARYRQRVGADWVADDPHLASILRMHGRTAAADAVREFAPLCAGPIDTLARENNRDEHLPRLRRYDGQGNRIESVSFHPSYHAIGRLVWPAGVLSRYRTPGRELDSLALLYLLAQNGEGGHTCPMACTAGLIQILAAAGDPRPDWTERLVDPDYDRHFRGAQFLTEVQGGSDVGANAVRARREADGWRLWGEKWFCSVIDAHLFLVTARPEGEREGTAGVRAFVVPRTLDGGGVNAFAIRRLKDKLGTRSMASAEVDFSGAWALEVGDFRQTVDIVLNTSRLYNAVVSAGMMQRAWREADAYARERRAFGQPILAFPTVARLVAHLKAQAYAARGLTFQIAALADRRATGDASDTEQRALRFLVNLNKFWTSRAGTLATLDAIEVLGGNGAIEEFSVLPRLLRDSIVCEAWEGGHNVLCAQALRDARRFGIHADAFALLERLGGPDPRLEALRAQWDALVAAPPGDAAARVRDLAEALRPVAQVAALRAEAAHPGSDPALPVVIAHLSAPPPLDDPDLTSRVRQLTGQVPVEGGAR